jgi:hypothetical protein
VSQLAEGAYAQEDEDHRLQRLVIERHASQRFEREREDDR